MKEQGDKLTGAGLAARAVLCAYRFDAQVGERRAATTRYVVEQSGRIDVRRAGRSATCLSLFTARDFEPRLCGLCYRSR